MHQPAVPIAIVLKIQNKTESKNNKKFTGKKSYIEEDRPLNVNVDKICLSVDHVYII